MIILKKIIGFFFDSFMFLLKKIPVQKTIVFESNPEFTCNTYPVYKYLVDKMHIDKEYKIVWLVNDPDSVKPPEGTKNVKYVKYFQNCKSFKDKFIYYTTVIPAKCLIFSNRILGKYRDDQFSLCLQHGMPLKSSNGGYAIHDRCDKCLCVSHFFADNYHKDFDISYEKMFFCGFPRTDYLFSEDDILNKLSLSGYDKVIMWLPTYRKIDVKSVSKFNIEGTATGIPTINTPAEIKRVDEWLRKNNMLLIFKGHPAQPIDVSIKKELTNFLPVTNEWLAEKDIQLYELLGKTDALITDYSSVYYDYLLTDKPVGLTVDDIDEYISTRGFVYDDPFEVLKGEKILDNDALIAFLENIRDGKDSYKEERTQVKNRMHEFQSGNCTEYLCNMIMEEITK